MRDSERLQRAREAELLLENERLIEAFELLEQRYTEAFRDTRDMEEKERTQLYHRMQALEALKRELKGMVEDGYVVRLNLEKTRKLKMWS